MGTPENDGAVRFLYDTALGRGLLKIVQRLHLDRLAVWYLRSRWSRPYIAKFARKNSIPLTKAELQSFPTYRDFFLRERAPRPVDPAPDHLVSPCDGWLSAFPVTDGCSFAIKGSRYRVADLLHIITTHTSTAAVRGRIIISRASSTASSPSPQSTIPSSP